MRPISFRRTVTSIALIAGVYVFARVMNWTGPQSQLVFVNELLVPGIILISLWGLWRLMGRSSA